MEEYIANKIQFHLPSEHYVTVDGQTPRYPVEIQIYHDIISTTNSIVTNQYMKVKRAVVSILFEEGEVEDGDMFFNSLGISKYNLNKDRQFNIPKVNGSDEVEIERQAVSPATYGPGFNILAFQGLLNLISADPSMYFYYGSDTTPPCEEDVLWMVFQKPRTLSRTQFNFLKQLLVKHVDKNKKINEATSRFDLFGNNRGVFIFDHIIRGGLIRSNPMGLLGVTNQNFYDTQSEEQ